MLGIYYIILIILYYEANLNSIFEQLIEKNLDFSNQLGLHCSVWQSLAITDTGHFKYGYSNVKLHTRVQRFTMNKGIQTIIINKLLTTQSIFCARDLIPGLYQS